LGAGFPVKLMDGPVLIVLPKWVKRLGTHNLHTHTKKQVKLKMRVGVVVDTTIQAGGNCMIISTDCILTELRASN
jgi:hypothetical protein